MRKKSKGLKGRDDMGDYWWELRSCAYMEDFYKPKIVYQELTQGSCFYYDNNSDYFVSNTGYLITGNHLDYLLALLNSHFIEYAFKKFYSTTLGESGTRWLSQHIMNLPLPSYHKNEKYSDLIINQLHTGLPNDEKIDNLVYLLYGLTKEEIHFLETR